MNDNKRTIKVCGKDVDMLYCAATETGYESISGKSAGVFIPPVIGKDEKGNDIYGQASATIGDFLILSNAAIIAAYARDNRTEPVSTEDILYNASAEDIELLIDTVIQLRKKWYHVPEVVKEEKPKSEESAKN